MLICVPECVWWNGNVDMLCIANILQQIGTLNRDCNIAVICSLEGDDSQYAQQIWMDQFDLFQRVFQYQGMSLDPVAICFAESITSVINDFYPNAENVCVLSNRDAISIHSEFSSEPIAVSLLTLPAENIFTDLDEGTIAEIQSGLEYRAIRIVGVQSVGKIGRDGVGTVLTLEEREDPGFAARRKALNARENSRILQQLSSEERSEILRNIADALLANMDAILEANQADLQQAEATNLAPPLRKRLKLTQDKVHTLHKGLLAISQMDEPIGKLLSKMELSPGLILTKETAPFGVLLVIFESRPDCLPQVVALALRSGNGLLLKGGKEAKFSNQLLHQIIVDSIEQTTNGRVSRGIVGLFETRNEIGELLKLDDVIDLIIPRGSGALVSHIERNTRIPVLGHSEGMCHIYIDSEADFAKAGRILVDAKTDYPAACNAVETLLLNQNSAFEDNLSVLQQLKNAGVTICAPPEVQELFSDIAMQNLEHYRMEYGDKIVSLKMVDSIGEAISHINKFGSGHTEAIITENQETAEFFMTQVDAGSAFHNASTRMADGFRYGLGAEVGISTKKVHARGPVGVMGLETTKWKLRSTNELGHCAGDFTSKAEYAVRKEWTHQQLPLD